MNFEEELTGNWEEKGVIGSRIEISNDGIVFLWQSGVVLQTTFTAEETDAGVIELHLAENGLRDTGTASVYATVERLYYQDGKLYYTENFPISGLSEKVMSLTDRSRYGYVTINDDLLANVQGQWEDTFTGHFAFEIVGDQMTMDGTTFRIHAGVNRYRNRGEEFSIIHQDPAVHGVGYFTEMIYKDGAVKAYLLVCDVGMHEVVFRPML